MQRTDDYDSRIAKCSVSALLGGVFSLILCILILLAFSALVLSEKLPANMTYLLTVFAAAVSTLAGGLFAARRAGGRYLLTGIASGLVFFLILLVVGFLFYNGFSLGSGFSIFLASLIGGACGGFIGNGGKRKRKR